MSALKSIQKKLEASKRSFANLTGSVINRTKSLGSEAMKSPASPTSLLRKATPSINRANQTLSPVAEKLGSTAMDFSVRPFGRLVARGTISAVGQKEYMPGKKTGPLSKSAEELLVGKDKVTSFKEGNRVLTKDLEGYVSPGKAKILAPSLIAAGTLMDAIPFGADDIAKQGGKKIGKEAVESIVSRSADDVLGSFIEKKFGKAVAKSERLTRLKTTAHSLYTQIVDEIHPAEMLEKLAQKTSGVVGPVEKSVGYKFKKYLGSGGVATLRHKKELKPILAQLGDLPKEEFNAFLVAKRDLGFKEAGREILGSDADEAGSVLSALSEKYGVDIYKEMEEIAGKLYAYQDTSLRKLVDSGFMDEAGYQSVKSGNIDYVPYKRIMDKVDEALGTGGSLQVGSKPDMLKAIEGSNRAIQSPLESIIADTYKIENLVAKNDFAKTISDLKDFLPEGVIKKASGAISDKNTMTVWRNGVKEIYEVPSDIENMIKGLDKESANMLTKLASNASGVFRQGQTGRNIDFMIPNIVKDQFDAAIGSKYGYIPFVDYFRGMAHLIKYDLTGADRLVEDWIKAGGSIAYSKAAGRSIGKDVVGVAEKKNIAKKLLGWTTGTLDVIGRYSETPTRLGVANKAFKKTGNMAEAVMDSREATVDFARMGSKMKVFNSVIPFLNPQIQGFDKLLRTAKNNPKKFALTMGTYGVTPAAMVSLYNNAYYGKDYAKVPEWEKESNFIIMTGGVKNGKPTYLKIPKGNIVPLIANPVDHFITHLYKNDSQSFGELATTMFSGALPVVGEGANVEEIASRTMGNNMPQVIKPAAEAMTNYDFFKAGPIESRGKQFLPEEERKTEGTPDVYSTIGGIVGISPLKTEKILEGYLAGFAKTPADVSEIIDDLMNGKPVDKNTIPVLRRFFGDYVDFEDQGGSKTVKKLKVNTLRPKLRPTPSNRL